MTRVLWVEKQIDYEPQGIMSMAAVLKQAGHEVALAICAQEDPVQLASLPYTFNQTEREK